MRRQLAIAVISGLFISAAVAQSSSDAKPYADQEAYKIYSLLLPHEESYGFAKDTLMIQDEMSAEDISGACLTQADTNRFKDAIAGYNRVNRKKWFLQRRLQIDKPYTVVSSDVISALPDHPQGSVSYVRMSPVASTMKRPRPSSIWKVRAGRCAGVGVSICSKRSTTTGTRCQSLLVWEHRNVEVCHFTSNCFADRPR